MNSPSNAIPEFFPEARGVAPAVISEAERLYWLVRRELWENRSIYIAPLAVAALVLFGFLIRVFHLPSKMRAALAMPAMHRQDLIEQPYTFAALFIMGASFIVAVFYCLDALHSERRDRSILFWKSLPVSDLTTVLSKATIPILVIPVLAFVITIATQWIMLMVSSVVALGSGLSVAALWRDVSWYQMSMILLYHLVALHGFWYAPIYGWLLLVSAWARRAVFLWAFLPLLAIGIVEKIAFNTTHFGAMLSYRFMGGGGSATAGTSGPASMASMTHPPPAEFLTSPSLWVGLVLTALCLAGAVRLRRSRGPI